MSTSSITRRAHRGDPEVSHLAAAAVNESTANRLKHALLELLREQSSAPFEVQSLYLILADIKGWPKVQAHSVNRRLSELKRDGFIVGTGEKVNTPDGSKAERLTIAQAVAA